MGNVRVTVRPGGYCKDKDIGYEEANKRLSRSFGI
jgi:hypothetical protein